MASRPSVVFVLPDKMGGALSIVANLLAHRRPDSFAYHAVLTRNRHDTDARGNADLVTDGQEHVEHSLPFENLSSVLGRLHDAVGAGPGVIVCNDLLELLLVASRRIDRAVVQILHGDYDYYYELAERYEPYVDAFVAYSRVVYERLQSRLPARRDSIFWLPYGIPLSDAVRTPADGPLRLLFAGRLDEAKGVYDLPTIDSGLRDAGVAACWSIVGDGPAGDALRTKWESTARVRWLGTRQPDDVRRLCAEHDVFVLPSRREGLSVATVEAMSAGLVPVVSDLPGFAEIVDGGTGVRVPHGNVRLWVDAIAALSRQRGVLETMSRAARALVLQRFDIHTNVTAYQELFARAEDLRHARPVPAPLAVGSRLDREWLPNPLVTAIRRSRRWLIGARNIS